MTVTESSGPRTGRTGLGRSEFMAMLSMTMAMAALGIDMMLPAFDDIRATFDLGPDSNQVAQIVTAYFLGMALAPVPYGAISDRWGRKPVLWLSMSVYVVGAVLSALSPSFGLLLVGRFIWGIGAAGGRVVAFAILRDTFEGDEMARTMSYLMAVFVLVPVLAPSIGALVITVAPWPVLFWLAAGAGIALLAWSMRLGETLRPETRRADVLATVPTTARRMATNMAIAGPVLALTAVMAVMSTYLASSELIIDDIFGRGDRFPLIFGAMALTLGVASMVNGRLLARLRIDQLLGPVAVCYLAAGVLLMVVTVAADGRPGFWVFMPVLALVLGCQMLLMPNLNTLALAPMADAAGTASALVATVTVAIGAILGAVVDTQFDDTVTPLAVAVLVAAAVVAVLVALTLRAGRTDAADEVGEADEVDSPSG